MNQNPDPKDTQKEDMDTESTILHQKLSEQIHTLESNNRTLSHQATKLMHTSLRLKRKVTDGIQLGLIFLSGYYFLGELAIRAGEYIQKSGLYSVHSSGLFLSLIIFKLIS